MYEQRKRHLGTAIMAERFLPNAPQERGDIFKAFATDHSVPK
jgi:hypothetical protein